MSITARARPPPPLPAPHQVPVKSEPYNPLVMQGHGTAASQDKPGSRNTQSSQSSGSPGSLAQVGRQTRQNRASVAWRMASPFVGLGTAYADLPASRRGLKRTRGLPIVSVEYASVGNSENPGNHLLILHGTPGGYDAGVILADWLARCVLFRHAPATYEHLWTSA